MCTMYISIIMIVEDGKSIIMIVEMYSEGFTHSIELSMILINMDDQ